MYHEDYDHHNYNITVRTRPEINWITPNALTGQHFDESKIADISDHTRMFQRYAIEDLIVVGPEKIFQYKKLHNKKIGGKPVAIAYYCNTEKDWLFGPVDTTQDNYAHCPNCSQKLYEKNHLIFE